MRCDVEDSTLPPDVKLDETIEETFPASDAPANTVETGIRSGEVVTEEIEPGAPETEPG